jgi:hypothetical protein
VAKRKSGGQPRKQTGMKKNMGMADKAIRILIAVVIGVLYFTNTISGTLAIILGIVAVAFVLTSFISFCPLYLPFGISTFKKKRK